jgi:Acyltransferase C-terminus
MRVSRTFNMCLSGSCCGANQAFRRGQYAQDIFTVKTAYLEGQPPKSVNMYWRRFALSSIPIDDPVAFEVWLRARWMEKDALIEAFYRHGRFPADRGAHKTREGKIIRGAGHIETEVKSNHWYEFLQIFAPVGVLALVLYTFYNALPTAYTEPLNRQNALKNAEALQKMPANLKKQQPPMRAASDVSIDQESLLAKAMTVYKSLSKNPAVQKVVPLPELTPKGLKNEMLKHQPALDTMLTQKNALQDLKTKFPPPGARPKQVAKKPNSNPNAVARAQESVPKVGQQGTGMPASKSASVPKSTSQKPSPTKPITAKPITAKPITAKPITAKPITAKPITAKPITANPFAANPSSAKAVLSKQTAKEPGPPKLPDKKPQGQATPDPKIQSKPKPVKPTVAAKSISTSK